MTRLEKKMDAFTRKQNNINNNVTPNRAATIGSIKKWGEVNERNVPLPNQIMIANRRMLETPPSIKYERLLLQRIMRLQRMMRDRAHIRVRDGNGVQKKLRF